jgi:hypothetical protein
MRHLWLPVAALTASLAISGTAAAATVTTVMTGLDNPRGLAFGPEGALYVAEAGRGGTGPCTSSIRPLEPGQPRCYGPSGAVSRLWRGVQERVVTGLPSYVNILGQATGPHDITMLGRGNAHVSIGWGADPLLRDALGPPWPSFNRLARVDASGGWRLETDIGAYELAANPDGGVLDSNPYGLFAEPGRVVVADAGADAPLAGAGAPHGCSSDGGRDRTRRRVLPGAAHGHPVHRRRRQRLPSRPRAGADRRAQRLHDDHRLDVRN